MADFPATLPLPQIADYAVSTAMGVNVVAFERGNNRLRRVAKRDRHVFTLAFVFTTAQLWTWQSWANQYGYDWHTMNLESAYSGLSITGSNLIPHTVRYISDIQIEAAAIGYFKVTVTAEMDVSTLPQGIITVTGNWYRAGTPATPSANRIIAGTPASPSTDTIIAGSPALPAA